MQSMLINSKKSERDKPSVCFVSPNFYPVLAIDAGLGSLIIKRDETQRELCLKKYGIKSIDNIMIRHLTQVKVQDLHKYKHTEAYRRLGEANISD